MDHSMHVDTMAHFSDKLDIDPFPHNNENAYMRQAFFRHVFVAA